MPIVFVHGVNNRDGEAFRENEAARNGFLREIVAPALGLEPDKVTILSPYWGQYGVEFAWGMAVLPNPKDEFEKFGGDAEAKALGRVAGLLAESGSKGNVVAEARRDLTSAVDLLYAAAMAGARSEEQARDLARSYVLAADYAQKTPSPDWVATASQGNFADQLLDKAEASKEERFGAGGILGSLKEGLSRLADAAPAITGDMAVRLLRKKLNASVTRFTGDAFAYLDRRGTKEAPGKIVLEVLNALRDAKNKGGDDKLVVIAHSFGGEIVYDILTYFDPTLSVDCLFTVGSQVGLFEEMKLYKASRPELPPDWKGRVIRPASLKRWLNVFDTNDVLGYRLEPIFNEVHDYYYDTGYSSFSAHGGYFMRPSFYKRLAARLAG
jgi:hypothetical protein